MENQEQKLKKIRQTKELEYGSFDDNMNNIGRMWSTLLGLKENIPGWLVSKLMQEKDAHIYRNWIVGYNKRKKK